MRQGRIGLRWPALVAALLSYASWTTYALIYRAGAATQTEGLQVAVRHIYALNQATFIAAVLGFGALWLNHGGPMLRYLTVGIFPFYIAHQTIIVVAGHNLAKLGLPHVLEGILLIAATISGCLLTYEVARRIGWAGLLLGVSPNGATHRVTAKPVEFGGLRINRTAIFRLSMSPQHTEEPVNRLFAANRERSFREHHHYREIYRRHLLGRTESSRRSLKFLAGPLPNQARCELQGHGIDVDVLLSDTNPAAREQWLEAEEGTVSKRARISRRT